MKQLNQPALRRILRKSYSAEMAAAFAYIGRAGSLPRGEDKASIRQIELDECEHRENLREIMRRYDLPFSRFYEFKYALVGKLIGYSCSLIDRFIPYFFAGELESGNVCEYFVMIHYFHAFGITEHDEILYEMGMKEKAHEVFFQEMIRDAKWRSLFERVFSWGAETTLNDV
ncbi:MAG: hypothetical protein AAGC73_08245, partial [Verrucomicrobiota bacterium]